MPAKGIAFHCLQASCWVPVAICSGGFFRRAVPGFVFANNPIHFRQGSSGPVGMGGNAGAPHSAGPIGGSQVEVTNTFAFGRNIEFLPSWLFMFKVWWPLLRCLERRQDQSTHARRCSGLR